MRIGAALERAKALPGGIDNAPGAGKRRGGFSIGSPFRDLVVNGTGY